MQTSSGHMESGVEWRLHKKVPSAGHELHNTHGRLREVECHNVMVGGQEDVRGCKVLDTECLCDPKIRMLKYNP